MSFLKERKEFRLLGLLRAHNLVLRDEFKECVRDDRMKKGSEGEEKYLGLGFVRYKEHRDRELFGRKNGWLKGLTKLFKRRMQDR